MKTAPLAAAAVIAVAAWSAYAQQPAPAPVPVTVVVAIPIPAGVPRARIEAGMRAAVPQYRQIPGLVRKYFTVSDSAFGGVYLFRDRASAQAWFSPAFEQRVRTTYGAPASITYFDVPIALDNAPVPASAAAQ